jgi:prolipoprotein diacylglyceryltransferase
LENSTLLPHSQADILTILSPQNFELHYTGLLITAIIGLGWFFGGIKRTENKKIRADIFFSSFCNALIILGIFLTLGDTFIGKPTDSIIAIKALQTESGLTKFDGVYPIGLFLSIGALLIHITITLYKIFSKKNGQGLIGMIALIILLNICFLYQNYPRHGLIQVMNTTLDIKQYLSILAIIILMCMIYRRNKKRFY